jgi:chondroitin synthase
VFPVDQQAHVTSMREKILSEAIRHYGRNEFAQALVLFERAAEQYGRKFVEINILLCRKALSSQSSKLALLSMSPSELDPATAIMLHNEGLIELDAGERQRHLERYRQSTRRKSEDADVRCVNPIPSDWPKNLVLAPLPVSTNDYLWHANRKERPSHQLRSPTSGLSIVIPTFNRSGILDITLACLVNQDADYPFEVVVADDGSSEAIVDVVRKYEPRLDIRYVRQKDYGYQLCAVRNLGLRTAKYQLVAVLDCDMAPNPGWVRAYMDLLAQDDDVVLIGPRKYVDTKHHKAEDFLADNELLERLPQVVTNNHVSGKVENDVSIDWRLEHFGQTDNLRLCDAPFRFLSGGNVAFAKKWLNKAGWFDEEFTHWGGEDNEFGYRLYRHGCFFRAVDGAMAYHQEPPGKENEIDRVAGKRVTSKLVREKVPYFYRKPAPVSSARIHKVPLVSIYVPAYNCADHIVRCVNSALNQTVVDLEVCICNDGSTDNTAEVLQRHYGKNPRVRIQNKTNGGIGSASNSALKICRGYYIGQLDSDDYLEPDAVEICLNEFLKDHKLVCVYTTNRNVAQDGTLIGNGYNWPVYSREKLTTAMIAHHFRMFTARAWNLTSGFDEGIANAVDYDMYLKLSEIGPFQHINKICYNRVVHGENTSIKKLGLQKINHFAVVNNSLTRQRIETVRYVPANEGDDSCRRYRFHNRPATTFD